MHWLHHILGTCGETSHPSIIWILGLGSTVGVGLKIYWYQLKDFISVNTKSKPNENETRA